MKKYKNKSYILMSSNSKLFKDIESSICKKESKLVSQDLNLDISKLALSLEIHEKDILYFLTSMPNQFYNNFTEVLNHCMLIYDKLFILYYSLPYFKNNKEICKLLSIISIKRNLILGYITIPNLCINLSEAICSILYSNSNKNKFIKAKDYCLKIKYGEQFNLIKFKEVLKTYIHLYNTNKLLIKNNIVKGVTEKHPYGKLLTNAYDKFICLYNKDINEMGLLTRRYEINYPEYNIVYGILNEPLQEQSYLSLINTIENKINKNIFDLNLDMNYLGENTEKYLNFFFSMKSLPDKKSFLNSEKDINFEIIETILIYNYIYTNTNKKHNNHKLDDLTKCENYNQMKVILTSLILKIIFHNNAGNIKESSIDYHSFWCCRHLDFIFKVVSILNKNTKESKSDTIHYLSVLVEKTLIELPYVKYDMSKVLLILNSVQNFKLESF